MLNGGVGRTDITPPVGIAHAGSNFHGPDENIRLDDFILGIKHVAATLYEYASAD